MTDILGAVNDFILAYIVNAGLEALEQRQIVRGWQNLVSALPPGTREYAVLTLLGTRRHGTNVHRYAPEPGDTGLTQTVANHLLHMVQVDFCCSYPDQGETRSRTRAELLEMMTRDPIGVDFFRNYNLSACYAEDPRPLPFMDETKQWVARYSVTMHLEGWVEKAVETPAFSDVGVYIENVDVHHPVKN